MDELLHHCLRELAFDGDLGSNVSRLRDFIYEFYLHSVNTQRTDDALCAYVWSLVVQQPNVLVGIVPPGITSEVYIAPQVSAKRKAKAKGEEPATSTAPKLDIIPDAKERTLEDLKTEYGDRLRVAMTPDAIYTAVTGSHIRYAKLSPMVYTTLQIITRGRDGGVSVVSIGQQTGYDQKTCFYLVRQLTEMDLVIKVRRGGVGTNFCIHKYFFDRSPSWKAIRDEETHADEDAPIIRQDNTAEDDSPAADPGALGFTPIDARHLSSLPIVRSRVVKLLKTSKNNIHTSQNLLVTLGFTKPTKTDRRFFLSRIREMIQQGIIEKVLVPDPKKRALVRCIRLVAREKDIHASPQGIIVQELGEEEEEKYIGAEQSAIKANVTIHRQLVDLLEDSGQTGMTLNELSAALYNFDKRTIELLLTRATKFPPPSHLSDKGVAGLMETSGRERRHRYYTIAAYRGLVAKEKLDKNAAGYAGVDLVNAGGFLPVDAGMFYENEAEHQQYQDGPILEGAAKAAKRGKPLKNPVLADGSVKLGRPRTNPVGGRKRKRVAEEPEAEEGGSSAKRVRVDGAAEAEESPVVTASSATPKKGGRPRKKYAPEPEPEPEETPATKKRVRQTKALKYGATDADGDNPLPKKRGRVSKKRVEDTTVPPPDSTEGNEDQPPVPVPAKRPRARKKQVKSNPVNEEPPSVTGDVEEVAMVPDPSEADPTNDVIDSGGPQVDAAPSPDSAIVSSVKETIQVQPVPELAQSPETSTPPIAENLEPLSELPSLTSPPAIEDSPDPAAITSPSPAPGESSLVRKPRRNAKKPERPAGERARVNVSHLRRENELLQVIEQAGGMVNILIKDFVDAHMALLETLSKAGEPMSAPVGTRTDKRTINVTFKSLEEKGRVKQLRTSITTQTGLQRPACIMYLPSVTQEQLNQFLIALGRSGQAAPSQLASFVTLDQGVEYNSLPRPPRRIPATLQLLQPETGEKLGRKDAARAEQLLSLDDATIREVLLTDWSTIGQVYGYIVGKFARARTMHLAVIDAFEFPTASPHVISAQHRIIDINFFVSDVSLGRYCSYVSMLNLDDELSQIFNTEGARDTLVRDLPPALAQTLQIGRSRSRSRILDTLELLRNMRLIVPLRPSSSSSPWITCSANFGHPTGFDIASSEGWTNQTPMLAPQYWHFTDIGPVYLCARDEYSPPFYKDLLIATPLQARAFWQTLEDACTRNNLPPDPNQSESVTGPFDGASTIVRLLRRPRLWSPDYSFTWPQAQYMKQFIEWSSGTTPLQWDEPASSQKIAQIAWVTCAPINAVRNYFANAHMNHTQDIRKVEVSTRKRKDKMAKRHAETKASLVKKAAEARAQREQNWDELIARVHGAPLKGTVALRLKRLRTRFVQEAVPGDDEKWEAEIRKAIREAELAAKKVLNLPHRSQHASLQSSHIPLVPQVVPNPPEKSIEYLIAQQGPPVVEVRKPKRKGRDGTTEETPAPKTRRHRFHWTRDYEELLRDACIIIRARCRKLPRLDWAALAQVFPGVPRNSVRQRFASLREAPGSDGYLTRLEDRWHELWLQYRGTPVLQDDDPESPSNFPLIKHIEFLRAHIDKNALRIGFGPQQATVILLLSTVEAIEGRFNVEEEFPSTPSWDFMWNAQVEEGREKKLFSQPFLCHPEEPPIVIDSPDELTCVAEAALKVVLGTSNERYDPDAASKLLHDVGDESVAMASKNLLDQGVLSKSVRDPTKPKPGRQLKISENNQLVMNGLVHPEVFQDAIALDEIALAQEDEWREWPLLATDGDMASLVQMVSDNKVEFQIDTTQAQQARPGLDWNSKKADDDQIETGIHVHYLRSSTRRGSIEPLPSPTTEGDPELSAVSEGGHGQSESGQPACCKLAIGSGLLDCKACLTSQITIALESLDATDQPLVQQLLDVIDKAGAGGLTEAALKASVAAPWQQIRRVLDKLTTRAIPLCFWTGYLDTVLVAVKFLRNWAVVVSENPMRRILPRRWYDISGTKIGDIWQAGLRAVMGLVIFRPGITETEMRWRLRSVYDRQEIKELLQYLQNEGLIKCHHGLDPINENPPSVEGLEEGSAASFWCVGDVKVWYQV